ncbi:hypothetical protein ACLMJK_002359 [Lecanora helva]
MSKLHSTKPNYPRKYPDADSYRYPESSLLNVGMRVRKSVPEGYKTRPKASHDAITPTSHQRNPLSQRNGNATPGFAELLPYCGILKTGGYAPQPGPSLVQEDLPPLQFSHEDWGDLCPSSQDSLSSLDSLNAPITPITIPSNKRRREDADEEDLDVEASPVSPRSRPVSHTPMPNLDSVREIKMPRSRRRVGKEMEMEMVDVGDFGEAEFLRPDEWGEGGIV